MKTLPLALMLLALTSVANAQHAEHGPARAQPYAGLDGRAVPSLSTEELDGLRKGRGLAMALPAELNGYPGPLHVLELADRLQLTPDQTRRTGALVTAMRKETIDIGQAVIATESQLDRSFKERRATPETIETETKAVGAARAALRAAHLRYHLVMAKMLNEHQIAEYRSARGYRVP